MVLQLHLGLPGRSVEDEDAVVGGHDDIELAIDIDVNHEDVGVPGIGKELGLPHHPRLAVIVRKQPALLGIGPAVAERIAHLKALQALYFRQDLGHFEDIVHRHDHLAAAEVENLRPNPPDSPLGADVPGIHRGDKGQGDRVVSRVFLHLHIALPGGDVITPALLRRFVAHLTNPRGPAAHVAVAAQLQPLAHLPVRPSRQHRQEQNYR